MSRTERATLLTQLRKPIGFNKEWIAFAQANTRGDYDFSEIRFDRHFAEWVWRSYIVLARFVLTKTRNDPAAVLRWKTNLSDPKFYLPYSSEDRQYHRAYAALVYFGRSEAIRRNARQPNHHQQWLVANVPLMRPRGMRRISDGLRAFIDDRWTVWNKSAQMRAIAKKAGCEICVDDHDVSLHARKSGTPIQGEMRLEHLRTFSYREFACLTRRELLALCSEHSQQTPLTR